MKNKEEYGFIGLNNNIPEILKNIKKMKFKLRLIRFLMLIFGLPVFSIALFVFVPLWLISGKNSFDYFEKYYVEKIPV